MAGTFLLMVRSQPKPGKEAEFTAYYDDRHGPDLLAVPGVVSARRFKVLGDGDWGGAFIGLYEVEADDIGPVVAELQGRMGTEKMPRSDDVDSQHTFIVTAIEAMPLRRAGE